MPKLLPHRFAAECINEFELAALERAILCHDPSLNLAGPRPAGHRRAGACPRGGSAGRHCLGGPEVCGPRFRP